MPCCSSSHEPQLVREPLGAEPQHPLALLLHEKGLVALGRAGAGRNHGLARARAQRGQAAACCSIKLGEVKLGEVKLGEVKLGEANLGEAKLGETKLGEATLGEVKLGE